MAGLKMLSLTGLLLSQAILTTLSKNVHYGDYYWREYNRIVPKDALPGGINGDHSITYIGQAVPLRSTYKPEIVPGQIIAGVNKLYYTTNLGTQVQVDNLKILCTQHPENFEWIRTTSSSVHLLNKENLIPGGFSNGNPVFIGRGVTGNFLAVSKLVMPKDQQHSKFSVIVNGNLYRVDDFEVLSYRMKTEEDSSGGSSIVCGATVLTIILSLLQFIT